MLNHLKIFSNGCALSRLSAIHYETLNLKLKCTSTWQNDSKQSNKIGKERLS